MLLFNGISVAYDHLWRASRWQPGNAEQHYIIKFVKQLSAYN
jgi:hypothetical protein